MKKYLIATAILSLSLLQAHLVFGAVSSPIVSKQGYGLGARLQQGGDSVPGSWNKVHFDFTFIYEGDTSDLKAFRLYGKGVGASAFSPVVEFNNLLNVTSSHSEVSGAWSLSRLNTTWILSKRNMALLTTEPVPLYEPTSAFASGTHSYYVTAVDSSGYESTPSQTVNLNILGPIQISEPASGATVSLVPNLRWAAALGWPDNQVLYLISIYHGLKTVWSKTLINKTGELTYDGPTLNTAKKYTLHIQGWWTSDTLKPLQTYFAGSQDVMFQVSAAPPLLPSPSTSLPPSPSPSPTPVACIQEVKLCSDGSYVVRVAPSCEFKACPMTSPVPPKSVAPSPLKTPVPIAVKPTIKPETPKPTLPTPITTSKKIEEKEKIQEDKVEKPSDVQNKNQEPQRGFFVRLWHRLFSFFFRE